MTVPLADPPWLVDLVSRADQDRTDPATPQVALLEYPVPLGMRLYEESIDLLRELQLIVLDPRREHDMSAPRDLLGLADLVTTRYGPMIMRVQEERERAFRAGQQSMTLSYPFFPGGHDLWVQYARTMEAVDAFCRSGALIHLETPPEIYALRRWTVEELVRQYDGAEPRPWSLACIETAPEKATETATPADQRFPHPGFGPHSSGEATSRAGGQAVGPQVRRTPGTR